MPHYKDGTKAEVGDHVVGKPYNTDHEVAGTVVSITPGADSCNLQVEFIESIPLGAEPSAVDASGGVVLPAAALSPYHQRAANAIDDGRLALTADHGTKGSPAARFVCRDYGEVKAFMLVARPAHVKEVK